MTKIGMLHLERAGSSLQDGLRGGWQSDKKEISSHGVSAGVMFPKHKIEHRIITDN